MTNPAMTMKNPLDTTDSATIKQAMDELEQLAFARSDKLGQLALSFLDKLQDPLTGEIPVVELEAERTPIFEAVVSGLVRTVV